MNPLALCLIIGSIGIFGVAIVGVALGERFAGPLQSPGRTCALTVLISGVFCSFVIVATRSWDELGKLLIATAFCMIFGGLIGFMISILMPKRRHRTGTKEESI